MAKRPLSAFEKKFAEERAKQGADGVFEFLNPKTGKMEKFSTRREDDKPAKTESTSSKILPGALEDVYNPPTPTPKSAAPKTEELEEISVRAPRRVAGATKPAPKSTERPRGFGRFFNEDYGLFPRMRRSINTVARKEYEDKKRAEGGGGMRRGGSVKTYAKGGAVGGASKRADGCATKGKTKGRFV